MPIVRPGTELFDDVVSKVPTGLRPSEGLPDVVNAAIDSQDPAAGWLQDELSLQGGNLWQMSGQSVLANTVSTIGQPFGGTFDAMIGAIGLPQSALDIYSRLTDAIRDKVVEIAKEAMLKVMLEVGIGFAVDVLSAIPVLGWIIDILWDFAMAIVDIVMASQEEEPAKVKVFTAALFTPAVDRTFANKVIAYTSPTNPIDVRPDWTNIFLPPGAGKIHGWQEPFSMAPLEGGGFRMNITDFEEKQGNPRPPMGYVPGSDWITRQYEVRPHAYVPQVTDTGRYFPTGRDTATTIWGMATKVGPTMFTIDAERCENAWRSYLGQLRDFIQVTGKYIDEDGYKKDFSRKMKEQMVKVLGESISPKPGKTWKPYNPDHKYQDWDAYGIDRMRPIRNLRGLAKAQKEYLTGPMLAYVDMTYGAFRQNSTMQGILRNGQSKLMQTAQRCVIDVENVPDREFQEALVASGVGDFRTCPPPLRANIEIDTKPLFDTKIAAPKNGNGGGRRGGGGGGLLIAAAVAALILKSRK